MTKNKPDVATELAKLRSKYLERLPKELTEIVQLARHLELREGPKKVRPQIESLRQRLHKLAGSGGTFGFEALSRQALELENTLQGWLSGEYDLITPAEKDNVAVAAARLAETLNAQAAISAATEPLKNGSPVAITADRRHKVWLVDDDVPLGQMLARLLSQYSYEVRLFDRIDATEAAAMQERPDILIMDVTFSDEGINATEALLERPKLRALGCPILFISAQGDFQSRVRAARLGAEGFMLKPIDVPKLVDRIERSLEEPFATPYRVLVVDDDVDLANHYQLVLNAAGMTATVLSQPEQAIDIVSSFQPELVLMDMHMPGCSGPELATVIRHHDEWVGLPIVYLSAETDIAKQLQAMSRGADDFLTKPISDVHLVSAVKVRAARSRQLSDLMSKDSLTGLLKHSRIKESITNELARAQRSGKPLSVAMLDIDHFKSVNDTYGHPVGDRVIKAVAHLLKQRLRKADGIGRYGGEEFVAILPECDPETAFRIIDDLRDRFSALRFQHEGQEFSCTFSAGIACSANQPLASCDTLLISADEALYRAKHGGRNQVCVAESPGNSQSDK